MNSQASLVDQIAVLIKELDDRGWYRALAWIYGARDDFIAESIKEIRRVAIGLGLYDADDWIVTRVQRQVTPIT